MVASTVNRPTKAAEEAHSSPLWAKLGSFPVLSGCPVNGYAKWKARHSPLSYCGNTFRDGKFASMTHGFTKDGVLLKNASTVSMPALPAALCSRRALVIAFLLTQPFWFCLDPDSMRIVGLPRPRPPRLFFVAFVGKRRKQKWNLHNQLPINAPLSVFIAGDSQVSVCSCPSAHVAWFFSVWFWCRSYYICYLQKHGIVPNVI